MLRAIVRILLTAFAFAFVLPKIDGITFTGAFFPDAVVYGLLFSVVAFVIGRAIRFAAGVFVLGTAGLGLLIVVPLALIGFWVLPAVQLMLCASWFPANLAVAGWGAAFLGGLVLLVVNIITGLSTSARSSRD